MKKKIRIALIVSICVIAAIVASYFTAVGIYKAGLERKYPSGVVNYSDNTVAGRFIVPDGYERVSYPEGTPSYEIQHQALKRFGLGAYDVDGKRIFDVPLWGVIPYPYAAVHLDIEAGEGSRPWSDIRFTEIDQDDIYPGCLIAVREDVANYAPVGHVLDICKNSNGEMLMIVGAFRSGGEIYVIGNPADPLTPWISVNDFPRDSGYGELIYLDYSDDVS